MEKNVVEIIFSKICEELKRRLKGKHRDTNIAGVEIKLRRCAYNITLEELAKDICSISYLSKLENSQIKPNFLSLHDICQRLNIDDETIDVLMSLDKILINSVNAYFDKDVKKLTKYYESGKTLENYRYKLISLIYFIQTKEYEKATSIVNLLSKIVGTLSDIDLLIYALFYDILYFKELNAKDLYDQLKYLNKIALTNDSINYLIDIMKIKCLFIMNSPLLIKKTGELYTSLINIARFDIIDDIKYMSALFFLFNNDLEGYEESYNSLKNKQYLKNLDLYKKILSNEEIHQKDLANVSDAAYLFGLAKLDKDKAKEMLNQSTLNYDDAIEFNDNIVEYLTLDDIEEKYNFIFFVALPSFKANKNKIVGKFFLDEIIKITSQTNKYKLLYQFQMEMI